MIPYLLLFLWCLIFSLAFATLVIYEALPRSGIIGRTLALENFSDSPRKHGQCCFKSASQTMTSDSPGLFVTSVATDTESLGTGCSYCTLEKETLRKSRAVQFSTWNTCLLYSVLGDCNWAFSTRYFSNTWKKPTSFHFCIHLPPTCFKTTVIDCLNNNQSSWEWK